MRMNNRNLFVALSVMLLIGLLLGSFLPVRTGIPSAAVNASPSHYSTSQPGTWSVGINVPAIDKEGKGVATLLTVEIKPGSGRILTNIDKLLFWVDTQASIQTAKAVAENYTGVNTDSIDIIYTITTDNATVIGGPSAGAALTLATIAALEHKQLNSSVMITGTINDDGSIGPVGGVLEKAKAAKNVGATLFLVPSGEGTETLLKPIEKCVQKPRFVYCETRYESVTISIGEAAGIDVKEVATIAEAAQYLLV
ncbi:MAG: S16 family serine protease [Candidatus Aenigmatarchaeota archaeon]